MSFDPPERDNPFEAPRTTIGERALSSDILDNDAELIRREHLGHEANVKSLGQLYYLGTFFGVIGTIFVVLMAAGAIPIPPNQQQGMDPDTTRLIYWGMAVFYLFATVLNGALGYGLTHLQTWARWTVLVFTVLGLLYVLFVGLALMLVNPIVGGIVLLVGGGINGFILYLLVAPKAGVVFSREYKEVIRKTPHVKNKTSLILKIFLGILIAIIAIAVLAAILSPR